MKRDLVATVLALAMNAVGWAADGGGLRWEPLNEPGSGGLITSLAINPHDSKRILVGGDVLGLGLSEDAGESWQSTFGLESWEIGDCTWHPTDPKIAWAGTMSGPYVSMDGGRHWQSRRQGMMPVNEGMYSAPIEKILFDPNDAAHLLAIGGSSRRMGSPGAPAWGAIWESKDGGANWARLSTITAEGSVNDARLTGSNIIGAAFAAGSSSQIYAAVSGAGLFVSVDGGRTWKPRNAGLPHTNIERVVAHPKVKDTLWICLNACKQKNGGACLPGGVFKSTDGGMTWASISNGLNAKAASEDNFTGGYKGFAVCASSPDVMYVCDQAWDTGVIYRTTDGGVHWQPVATKQEVGLDETNPVRKVLIGVPKIDVAYFSGLSATVMAIDANNPEVVFAGGSEYILRSVDGGKSWADMTSVRAPGGAGWCGRGYSGLCCTNFRFDPRRPNHALLLAMDAGKLWESTDGLKTWTFHGGDPWPWGGGNDAAFAGEHTIYTTTGQFGSYASIFRTSDGKEWKALRDKEHGLPAWERAGEAQGIYALPESPQQVWACVGGKLYASADGGEQWRVASAESGLTWIAPDPKQPLRFYVSGENNVYRTEDGRTFTSVGGPKVAGRMTCDSEGRLYLAAWRGERGGLWCYETGKWRRLLDDPYIANVAVDPTNPQRVAICTNDDPYHDVCHATGVWISADRGKSWTQASEGLAMLRGQAIAFNPFDPEQVVFGTLGRGFFVARWAKDFAPTGVKGYEHTAEDEQFAAMVAPGGAGKPQLFALVNGSMTEGGDVPTGWEGKWGKVQTARDATVYKVAPASLRVETTAAEGGEGFQMLEGGAGTKLRVSGWVKTAGDVKVNVAVQSFDASWTKNEFKQIKYLQDNHDWTAFEGEVTIPDWAARFNVNLLVQGNGRAWLDEVKLESLNAAAAATSAANAPSPTNGPPPKDKPSVAGWGFFPQFPQAWMNFHRSLLDRTKQGNIDIVFLGDSITQGWGGDGKEIWEKRYAPLKAVNYGIGGDSTRQVLWRIENGEHDGLSPKLIVLKIGTNNLYGDFNAGSDEEIAQGIGTIIKALRAKLPQTKILLLGILPRQNDWFCGRIKNINAIIAKLDDGKTVRFLDMGDNFLDAPGKVKAELYNQDQLHLVRKGYEAWAETMQPLLDQMLK